MNKFRNKFNVNGNKESQVDAIIRDEVTKLLKEGHAYEANLYKLDKKLDTIISEHRKKNPVSKD